MKACFIVGTLARGGAEKQLLLMLRVLSSRGIETRVMCLTRGEELEDEIKSLGIDVEWIGRSESRLMRLGRIIKSLRDRPADIIQSSHFYTNIYAAAAGRLLGIVSIGAIRNDVTSEINASAGFGRWQLRMPKYLIANSTSAMDRAIAIGIERDRITCLKNVVESRRQQNDRERNAERRISILFAGRLVAQKRPDLFIDLAAALRETAYGHRLKYEMVGDGQLRPQVDKLVQTYGFGENEFKVSGYAPHMSAIYERTDILLLTSDHEGTPNVVLEAMSHGIPVIATDVGGVREILGDQRGMIVDRGDIERMTEAVSKLVSDPDLRRNIGSRAAEFVRTNHSLEYLENELSGIYDRLLVK